MLNQRQQAALRALLTNPTRATAAAAAGIDEKTLRKYLRNGEFLAAYRAAFDDLVDAATRQAQQAINPALSTLTEICQDYDTGPTARVNAARALLEYAARLTEVNDLAARVAELEKAET